MKIRTPVVLCAALLLGTRFAPAADESSSDVVVRFQYVAPAESEDWDRAVGLEGQFRLWGSKNVGVALAVGYQSWAAVEDSYVDDSDGYYSSLIEGDAAVMPVGVSLLGRGEFMEDVNIVVEGGLRYAFVDSSIESSTYYERGGVGDRTVGTIDIENAVLGILAVELDMRVSENLALTLGIGYQLDLSGPKETYLGESIGDTDFSGTLITAGACLTF